ncbi:MAG: hypothetical protein KA240_01640 [Nitrospira sp.]|nr:hypothetical protein [Nitrospira sp.]MBP6604356.1 hypothetical protein [Nitrospira sp.]HQY57231.1 hypothetical protein [Nitrospira sp.]
MPADTNRAPIQIAWINFVKSVTLLLVPQTDDRPLDQYLPFRDAVLNLVQSEKFLMEFNKGWTPPGESSEQAEIKQVFLLELEAFPRAVEVVQATTGPEESKASLKHWLGRASTVCGSAKDLKEDLPWYAKGGLTAFKELLDVFKG